MKKLLLALALASGLAFGAITAAQKYQLNKWMGPVALTNTLGTLIDNASNFSGSSLADGKILVGDSTGAAAAVTPSGDVTISNTGVTAIGSTKVTNGMLAGSIAFSKLTTLTSGNILVGNGSNVAAAVAMSGDATISNAGVVAIGSNKVVNAMVDPTVVKWADTMVTTAQVLALNTTPISLLAAPGAGLVNVVRAVYATITYAGTAYVCDAAGLTVRYTNGSGALAATLPQTFCQAAADAVNSAGQSSTAITPVANAALVLFAANANPTTGTSGIKVRVYYTQAPNPLP